MLDNLQGLGNWTQYVPFAAVVIGTPAEERPAMTKIIEQSFVGIVAAMLGSYVTINVHQAEISNMKQQRAESEQRTAQAISEVSRQVAELRQVMLRRNNQ